MPYEVSLKESHAQFVLTRRLVVESHLLGQTIARTFQEIYGYLSSIGVPPAGAPFVVYHTGLAHPDRWDVELCVPVSRPVDPPENCEARTVTGGPLASTLHRGPYEEVAPAYAALRAWMEQHGYVGAGAPREIYLSPPGTPADEIRTLIEWPLAPAELSVETNAH